MISKKKLTSIFTLLALTLLLCTGCVRSGIGVVINEDDTGKVEISTGIDQKYYNAMLDQAKEDGMEVNPFEGKETTTVTEGDTTYICLTETKEFKTLDELKTILTELEYGFEDMENVLYGNNAEEEIPEAQPIEEILPPEPPVDEEDDLWIDADESDEESEETETEEATENLHIFKSVDITHTTGLLEDRYHVSLTTTPQKMYEDDEQLALDMIGMGTGDMVKLSVSITMPGTLVSNTAEITENTATFTVTDFSVENILTVDSSVSNIAALIVIAVVIVILIVAFALIFGKKKNGFTSEK